MADNSPTDINDYASSHSISSAHKKATILSSLNSVHSTQSSSPRLSLSDLQQTLQTLREFISSARTHIQQDPLERRRVSVAVAGAIKLIEAEEGDDAEIRSSQYSTDANHLIRNTLIQEGYTNAQAEKQIEDLKNGGEIRVETQPPHTTNIAQLRTTTSKKKALARMSTDFVNQPPQEETTARHVTAPVFTKSASFQTAPIKSKIPRIARSQTLPHAHKTTNFPGWTPEQLAYFASVGQTPTPTPTPQAEITRIFGEAPTPKPRLKLPSLRHGITNVETAQDHPQPDRNQLRQRDNTGNIGDLMKLGMGIEESHRVHGGKGRGTYAPNHNTVV